MLEKKRQDAIVSYTSQGGCCYSNLPETKEIFVSGAGNDNVYCMCVLQGALQLCSSSVCRELVFATGKGKKRPASGRGHSQKSLPGGELGEAIP